MSDKPVTLPRLAVDPDEREGYEWNAHIVEADRPHMRVCFMSNGPNSEVYAELLVTAANERPSLLAQLAAARGALEKANNFIVDRYGAGCSTNTELEVLLSEIGAVLVSANDCDVCGGDCSAANPPVMNCPRAQEPAGQSEAHPLASVATAGLGSAAVDWEKLWADCVAAWESQTSQPYSTDALEHVIITVESALFPAGSASPGVTGGVVAWQYKDSWKDHWSTCNERPASAKHRQVRPLYAHPTVKVSGDAAEMRSEDLK